MIRLIFSLSFLLITCVVFAAPAPKSSWDRHIDPDQDCKFVIKGGTVTIELPGSYHDLDPRCKRFNAPRLLRDVEGDFVMQTRVSASFRPSAKSTVNGMAPRVAAGLVLITSDKDYIRLEFESYRCTEEQRQPDKGAGKEKQRRKPELRNGLAFNMLGKQTLEMRLEPNWKQDHQAKEEQIYLRFERQGNRFRESISPDGKTWTNHVSMEGFPKLPRKLKVGLAAYSTSSDPFKVRFDQFKFNRGDEKDK